MATTLHELAFDGTLLERGFWLYVWQVTPASGEPLFYVGRTGDNSTINAQSPFYRIGQHLGGEQECNMLRRYLQERGLEPETCAFRLVAVGPIMEESRSREEHFERRDHLAAMEKALSEELQRAGCELMNRVRSAKPLDAKLYATIRAAFASAFPELIREPVPRTG